MTWDEATADTPVDVAFILTNSFVLITLRKGEVGPFINSVFTCRHNILCKPDEVADGVARDWIFRSDEKRVQLSGFDVRSLIGFYVSHVGPRVSQEEHANLHKEQLVVQTKLVELMERESNKGDEWRQDPEKD